MTLEHTSAITASSSRTSASVDGKGKRLARHSWSRRSIKWSADDSSKTADAMDAARGASFAADQDEGPQRGSGRPIPPLVFKIQVPTTNAGARAQGGLTPNFLALSVTSS